MNRRTFLLQPGAAAILAAVGPGGTMAAAPEGRPLRRDAEIERRVARYVQVYDSQGNHRTATAGDIAAATWLQAEVRAMGAGAQLEDFPIDRVDPGPAYVEVGGRRIDGVPVFDAAFSDAGGIKGRLGALGSDAEIALVESDPFVLLEPQREQRSAVAEARKSKHKAAIVLTRGSVPGVFLLNAIGFMSPSGPPMLQVSSVDSERLKRHAARLDEATVVVQAGRTPTQASNVVVSFAGKDPSLAPLVVSTPRSGWWQCAGERGGGIACWLESIRAVAAARPERDVVCVAFSGHETGFIGIDDFLARRPGLAKRAALWMHYGTNIGVPDQENLVNVSEPAVSRSLSDALEAKGLGIDHLAAAGVLPRGEARTIHRAGARYLSLVCGTDYFHHPADRWPEAVDVARLGAYASAFSAMVAEVAMRKT
ncbi:MAG: hypothetical protein ACXWG1_08740 [Usitatibacter sp.]